MKKLLMTLAGVVSAIALSLPAPASACEYVIPETPRYQVFGSTYNAVITGINARNNVITAWWYDHSRTSVNPDVDKLIGTHTHELEALYDMSGTMWGSRVYTDLYARELHLIRQTPPTTVSLPITLYVDFIGVKGQRDPWKDAYLMDHVSLTLDTKDLSAPVTGQVEFSIYYRVSPFTNWTPMKSIGLSRGYSADSSDATVSVKSRTLAYVFDKEYPAGTQIQFMCYGYSQNPISSYFPGNNDFAFSSSPPAVLYGATLSCDYITITVGDKRRPRHDQ